MSAIAKNAIILLLTALIAACSATPPPAAQPEATEPTSVASTQAIEANTPEATVQAEAPAAGFPLTIENCGVSQTFNAPPQRAIALYLNTSEILAAIGATEHVIGIVANPAKVLSEYADALSEVKVLSESEWPLPSREIFLAEQPDFILTGAGGDFSAEALGTREELQQQGIATYQMSATCPEGDRSLSALQADILNLGKIFGVSAAAEAFVSEQNTRIAAVAEQLTNVEPVTVVHIDGVDTAPYIGHGQLLNELLAAAGAVNAFAELATQGNSSQVSWEEVVARNPNIILISDYDSPPIAELSAALLGNPVLAEVSAIQQNRLYPILLADITTGARSADAVESLAKEFHPEIFP